MKKVLFLLCVVTGFSAFTVQDHSIYNGGTPIYATLLGENERPNPGDPDGSGTFEMQLNQGQGTLTYVLTAEAIATPTAAHIHIAPPEAPGPVVVPLAAPVDGVSTGVIYLSKELIKALRQNPEAYYVNVHNAEYPAGAIRGQLSKHQ